MTLLLLPYAFNILVLVPIGLMTLFGGERGGQLACQGKFPESAGFRTILGSLWTAILVGSVVEEAAQAGINAAGLGGPAEIPEDLRAAALQRAMTFDSRGTIHA